MVSPAPAPPASPPESAVVASAVVRRFGATLAVDGLSFDVHAGETFGLLGHNGAGKTTTIRLLNGVLRRESGSIEVLGRDPAVDGVAVRSRTGVLTETPSLDERLSATENLSFVGLLYGVSGRRLHDQVAALLEAFGLTDRANHRVATFSRGMKQRLALARTLVHDPDILFLDEPTAALDPVAARDVHGLVEGFRRDRRRTVILTTHNLFEAQRLCDRVLIMERGQALATGSPQELARTLVARRIVDVDVPEAQRDAGLAALARAGLGDASVTDRGLAISVERADDIPVAVAALAHGGVAIYRVAEREPDLEAAYFALHRMSAEGQRGPAEVGAESAVIWAESDEART